MDNKLPTLTVEPVIPWYKRYKGKKLWSLGLTVFSVITTLLLVVWVRERQLLLSEAAENEVTVSLIPSAATLTPTSPQDIKLKVLPGKAIGFINLELNFDPAKIKLNQPITILEPKFNQEIKLTTPAEANVNGKIIITVGLDPNQRENAPTQVFDLAKIQLIANTANPNLSASLNFNNAAAQLVAVDASIFTVLSNNAQFTVNPTAGPKLFFSNPTPANPQTVNGDFSVTLKANTENQEISGFDAKLIFDKTRIQIVKIDPIANNGFNSYPTKVFDNNAGTAYVAGNIGAGASTAAVNGNNISLASVTFKPLVAGDATISYIFTAGDRNDSNLVKKLTDQSQDPIDILTAADSITINTQAQSSPALSPSPKPIASPSPSPAASLLPNASPIPAVSPSPNPQALNIKLNLQGRNRTGVNLAKSLTLDVLKNNQTAPVRHNLATTSAGEIAINLTPDNYIFLVKIPGYLSRRFGSTTNKIYLEANDNFLDLSATPILGGDFNNDGEINEVDYTSQFLLKFGNPDPVVDLDGSGQVNNLDFAIMRVNWNLIDDLL